MTPRDFWNIYAGGFKPLDFMRLFKSQDPAACARAYVTERPSLFGIVRRGTWRDTFAAERQHTRLEVHAGLVAYLEESEAEWRGVIEEELAARQAERAKVEHTTAEEEQNPGEADQAEAPSPPPGESAETSPETALANAKSSADEVPTSTTLKTPEGGGP